MTSDLHKAMKIGPHIVPGVWRYLLPEDFQFYMIPAESKATCLNCPKVKEEGFQPDTRCCTYHPRTPNFLMGLGLIDSATQGLMLKMVDAGFVTPEGMQHSPQQAFAALDQHSKNHFGKNKVVVCPFLNLESKLCQIYLYRNAVCSTFFCKSDFGSKGFEFWDKLQTLVGQLETALSQWAMAENGFDVESYFSRFDSLADILAQSSMQNAPQTPWSDEALDVLWNGRDRKQFLIDCGQSIESAKENLFEIACQVDIKQPHLYDEALRASLPESLQKEQDDHAPVGGKPVPIEDLWYQVQLAQRNLKI